MIRSSTQAEWTTEQGLEIVVSLAERYYDRVDAAQFLELLPTDMPLASLLRYFKIVLEYGSAKKRNLQVRARCGHHAIPLIFYSLIFKLSLKIRSSTNCCVYVKCKFGQIMFNDCKNKRVKLD